MQAALKPLRIVKPQPAGELETLFQTHHGRVFRTAQRITGSAADAEDVLQTVFLRLVKTPDAYDLSRNPEAYLSRAAINASLDLLRSRTRAKSVALDETDMDTIAGHARSPEALHADRELQTLVRQAVARLGKTAGEMFVLRYYEGFLRQSNLIITIQTMNYCYYLSTIKINLIVGMLVKESRKKFCCI